MASFSHVKVTNLGLKLQHQNQQQQLKNIFLNFLNFFYYIITSLLPSKNHLLLNESLKFLHFLAYLCVFIPLFLQEEIETYSNHCQLRMAYFFQHMFMLQAVAALYYYYYYYYFLKQHNFILGSNIKAVHIS